MSVTVSSKRKKIAILFLAELLVIEVVILLGCYPNLWEDAADWFTFLFPGAMCLLLFCLLFPCIVHMYRKAIAKIQITDEEVICRICGKIVCALPFNQVQDYGTVQLQGSKYWYISAKTCICSSVEKSAVAMRIAFEEFGVLVRV